MPTLPDAATLARERRLILLVGAVQFVNILDFMMVMPLGPDFARDLGIPESRLGLIGGSYTAAAAVGGLIGSTFLDRVDRRVALACAMAGLFVGTVFGGLATGLGTLILARIVAGLFGGPATAVALAIVADAIPAERRGRAMGAVMTAFSVASIAGVPIGLELARLGSWRTPFFAVAALGVVVAAASVFLLPPMRAHLGGARRPDMAAILRQPGAGLAVVACASLMVGSFTLIPNISSFYQGNLGYPREHLGVLYVVGGITSVGILRIAGRSVDRWGSAPVAAIGTVLLVFVMVGCYALEWQALPPMAWFVLLMAGMSVRNVAWNTLSSRVPSPGTRAGYMSALAAVQHGAAALGAGLSTWMLVSRPGGGLDGLPRLVTVSAVASVVALIVIARLERRVVTATTDYAPAR